jgi:hypothetical protein
MVKLTNILFEISEETQNKIERIKALYEDALNNYDAEMIKFESNPYGEVPTPPREPKPIRLKDTDYKRTEVVLYIPKEEIVYVTQNLDGDTVIMTKLAKELVVKGTIEEVYATINN